MSTEPQVTKSYDRMCDCARTTVAYPSTINLKTTPLVGIIITGGAVSSLPNGSKVTVSVVGPSDTIPAPPAPGQLQSIFARTKGAAFTSVLQGMLAAGLVEPSDTIPAPPAPGGGGPARLSNGNLLVWVPVEFLAQRNLLTSTTTGLIVTITKGNQTLYTSDLVKVGIIGPEKGL